MKATLELNAEHALVLLSDGETTVSPQACRDPDRRELRGAAQRGELFYLDTEDPMELRVAVYVDEPIDDLPRHSYERTGGAFLLSLPSGVLRVLGGRGFQVVPGAYSLRVWVQELVDSEAHEEARRAVLCDDDWRYRRLVGRLAIPGCILFLAAWVVVFVYGFSAISLVAVIVALLSSLPYYLLSRTRRYRATEKLLGEYASSFPQYALELNAVGDPSGLVGGYLVVS